VELFRTEGSVGAALGAGIGAGIFSSDEDAFSRLEKLQTVEPDASQETYNAVYAEWKQLLELQLNSQTV
jgi:xylulokinase